MGAIGLMAGVTSDRGLAMTLFAGKGDAFEQLLKDQPLWVYLLALAGLAAVGYAWIWFRDRKKP